MILRALTAGAMLALAVSTPVLAQGRSQSHRNKGPAPPSRNDSIAPSAGAVSSGGATPLAWLDDASILEPGGMSLAISALRWTGSGISEVTFPVVDIGVGLTRRVQFSASVPHVVGSADPYGAAGGLGTLYFSSKIGLLGDGNSGFKLAVSPTLEVLSPGVVESLAPGEHRVQMGFPVSAGVDRGPVRIYGGMGYFTRGAWFTGAGGSYLVNNRVSMFGSLSRAWRRSDVPDVPLGDRDRKEISGGASYAVSQAVHVFGSMGRTVATLEENGAGATIAGGVSFFFRNVSK